MENAQQREDQQEDQADGKQLFADVGEPKEQFLREKHKRHEPAEVPEDADHRMGDAFADDGVIIDGIGQTGVGGNDGPGGVVAGTLGLGVREPNFGLVMEAEHLFVGHAVTFLESQPFLGRPQQRAGGIQMRKRQGGRVGGEVTPPEKFRLSCTGRLDAIHIEHESPVLLNLRVAGRAVEQADVETKVRCHEDRDRSRILLGRSGQAAGVQIGHAPKGLHRLRIDLVE